MQMILLEKNARSQNFVSAERERERERERKKGSLAVLSIAEEPTTDQNVTTVNHLSLYYCYSVNITILVPNMAGIHGKELRYTAKVYAKSTQVQLGENTFFK